jgi:hypothetical protein
LQQKRVGYFVQQKELLLNLQILNTLYQMNTYNRISDPNFHLRTTTNELCGYPNW